MGSQGLSYRASSLTDFGCTSHFTLVRDHYTNHFTLVSDHYSYNIQFWVPCKSVGI